MLSLVLQTGRANTQRIAEGSVAGEVSITAALTNRIGRCTTTRPVCYFCKRLRRPQHQPPWPPTDARARRYSSSVSSRVALELRRFNCNGGEGFRRLSQLVACSVELLK